MKIESRGPARTREVDRRLHNVFFNVHTVSGIVISVALYVIFLAGAFALFQNNINNWEINERKQKISAALDYDRILYETAKKGHQMYGRDLSISLRENDGEYIGLFSRPPANKIPGDSLKQLSKEDSANYVTSTAPINYIINTKTYELIKPDPDNGPQQRIGRLLTRLHYFQQIPTVGLYLSGLVSLFFLFAIVTGVIVHWRKIISNFFTFRLRSSVKNLWTDAHTALGVLGLPFQFMYAVTGAFFGLGIVVLPFAMLVFGDVNKATEVLLPARKTYELSGESDQHVSINPLMAKILADIPAEDIETFQVNVKSYGDQNAHLDVLIGIKTKQDFSGQDFTSYRLTDGELAEKETYRESSFKTASINYFIKLHFGSFGGYFVKGVYFLLAILTCFVIISGVMVWLVAREKKAYAHKAKFNRNVGALYLGACLGLYPSIALLFIVAKVLPMEMSGRFDLVNYVFFGFWLAYTLYAVIIKNYFKINKHALLLSAIMGLAIPIVNGLVTGLWFWKSLGLGYVDSFFIDIAWLMLGAATLMAALIARPTVLRENNKKLATKEKAPANVGEPTPVEDPVLVSQPGRP